MPADEDAPGRLRAAMTPEDSPAENEDASWGSRLRTTRAARIWRQLRSSFWFTPAVIVVASMIAAVLLIDLPSGDADLADWSPRLFGAGADGSRAMLSAIATSMITVAGVVFSITIVTLSLSSTQYSPRVLRNFMRDGPTQVVLGVFLGIFAYCLVVLRTIRGGDEGGFIPSMAVLGGIAYAMGGIAMLIYFIHHVATSIQASAILGRIADDTKSAIDHLFPQQLGESWNAETGALRMPDAWVPVPAPRSGYLTTVDADRLLQLAERSGRVLRLRAGAGDYVSAGEPLVEVGGEDAPGEDLCKNLREAVVLGSQRTVDQDAAYGLQQLVDVGLRALSPGVNDPTTACMCIDQLSTLLARLAERAMPGPYRFSHGELRVIAPSPEFATLLAEGLLPIVRHSRGDLQVLQAIVVALERVADVAVEAHRRRAVQQVARDTQVELARVRPHSRAALLRRRLRPLSGR